MSPRKRRRQLAMGDEVMVPEHPGAVVGRITSEPNWNGKVRVDWDDSSKRKTNQWAMLDNELNGQRWAFYDPALLQAPPEEAKELAS
jgi:hypothetical protein